MVNDTLVQVDVRGRVSLSGIATEGRYVVTKPDDSGRIVLEPAVVLTQAQLAVLRDPDIRAAVDRARKEEGPGNDRPS